MNGVYWNEDGSCSYHPAKPGPACGWCNRPTVILGCDEYGDPIIKCVDGGFRHIDQAAARDLEQERATLAERNRLLAARAVYDDDDHQHVETFEVEAELAGDPFSWGRSW